MNKMVKSGRLLFALAIMGFGIIHFFTGNFPSAFLPMPASIPARTALVYLTGLIFLILGICELGNKGAKTAAAITGLIFFLFFLFLDLPKLISNLHDPNQWTVTFETLSMGSGGFILAAAMLNTPPESGSLDNTMIKLSKTSRYFFAISLVIFGIQHIMYSKYIITLMPSWIPGHVFWSYVVPIAFISAALAIFLNLQVILVTYLLAIMFLLWVVLLHAPRVAMNPGKEAEWASLCIAMAMSGIFFLLNGISTLGQIVPRR